MLVIEGYKLEGQDVNAIEMILQDMKNKIDQEAKRKYRELLAREIETILDDIVLNVIPRPENITIYDLAVNELNQRIAYASGVQNITPYNFNVSCHILFKDGNTYFKINSENHLYTKRFKSINGLTDFSLEVSGIEGKSKREEEWESLMTMYSKGVSPLGVQLYPDGPMEVKDELLKFRSPKERADERARYTLTSRYLSMFSCEREIPNFRLMQRMDEALNALDSDISKEEIITMRTNLMQSLPNITLTLVKSLPGEESHDEKEEDTEKDN